MKQLTFYPALLIFSICAFTSNAQWTFVEEHADGGVAQELNGVKFAVVSPDDKHLYCASESDWGLIVWSINAADGKLTFVEEHVWSAPDNIDRPEQFDITPDGKYIYLPERGDDEVSVWSRNAATGALTKIFNTATVNDPYTCRVSPDGKHLYVGGLTQLRVYTINANGSITTGSTVTSGVGGGGVPCGAPYIRYVREIVFQSDGSHVYTSGNGTDNASVDVFSRNTTTGALTWLQSHNGLGSTCDGANPHANATFGFPYDLDITPDDQYLYVATSTAQDVIRFSIDAGGTLTYLGTTPPIAPGGTWNYTVKLTPDGSQLFVAIGPNVNVYDVNAATGGLTFVESHVDATGPYNELYNTGGFAFTSSGEFVYAMAIASDGITVLNNPTITLDIPVEGFNGVLNSESNAELSWHTLSENKLLRFEVQKSLDGVSYESIGLVQATGNSSIQNKYEFTDLIKVDEIAYYRLKSVDEDSKSSLSNVVILRYKNSCDMQVWLNDQSGNIMIDANTCSGVNKDRMLSAELYDVNGRVIRNLSLDGVNSTELYVKTLPAGIYFVRVRKGDKVYKQKIVIP